MFTAESGSLEALSRNLDQLTRQFVAIVLRLEGPDTGRIVDGMLSQIGETLAADYVSFEADPDDGVRRTSPQVWRRRGATRTGEAVLTTSVDALGHRSGVLSIGCADPCETWPPVVEERLKLLAGLFAMAGRRAGRSDGVGYRRNGDVRSSSRELVDDENRDNDGGDFDDIIGDSPLLRVALRRVLEVAPTDASVVLLGETGTGKELFARAVHNRSRRRGRPFVRVNCAALPPTLIESELFGHERGAFTGAVSTRRGRFELAHSGTLFLDEIGDLPLDVQAKLLRVLQEGEFERVGSSESRKVDVRIVAATHHDLDAAVKDGRFRLDLYYRLNVFPIALPPLRERTEDIPRLAWFFINQRQRALNRRFTSIPPPVLAALRRHSWPGNVRELENVIERGMIHSTGCELRLDEGSDLPVLDVAQNWGTLESVERRHIESVLRRCNWRINGLGNAADVLGLHPNTLRFRMKKLGVERPKEPALVVEAGRLSA